MIAAIRAQLELRLGYVPALFDPAFISVELLESLWQQTRAAYLDSPLPARFKESLLLAVMRRCPTPYGLVGHAAALARQGVPAAEVLALLEGPGNTPAEARRHLDVLCACTEPWKQWPAAQVLADAVLACSVAYALEPSSNVGVQVELRRLLPVELYTRWAALMSYLWTRWQWCAAFPELALRTESALSEARARLLAEEPGLAAHLSAADTMELGSGRRSLPTPDALSQIIDAVPTGILQLSIDGAVVMTNAPAQRMFGLTANELSKLTVSDLEQAAVQEDGKPCLPEAYPMTRCLRTLTPQQPTTLGVRRKDGELFWATFTALPLMDPAAQETTGVMVTIVDVSERKRTERALRDSEDKYRVLVEASDAYVLCLDREGRITRANEQASQVLRLPLPALIGKTMHDIISSEELADAHHARYIHVMETGHNLDVEEMIEAEGKTLWFASTVVPLRDHTGEIAGVQVIARDVTSKRRAEIALRDREERSKHEALHDPLTRLPNRLLFMDRLEMEVIHTRQAATESRFAVLCLDLDRFKNINDSLGHSAGDRLLIEFSRRLHECIGPEDTLARLGGDEFAILLRSIHDASDAIRVADRVLNLLKQPFTLRGQDVYVPTSVGIALSASGYERPEDVLRDADTAMYRAKRRGKGRYELFDAGMHAEAVALLTLENDLRRAIERGEFQVYYQPVIDLGNGNITGFEALLRWNHPARGIVLPGEFIGCAEETGLIVPIGEWVLREACNQMRRWHEKYPRSDALTISVNLSGKQFSHPALIGKALRDSALSPSSLKLEITESVIMEDPLAASKLLEQLQRQEVQSYVDDFGTGYSSLSYLHRFPMSALKIDRSFVTNIGPGGENAAIVQTIVTLAHNLGMSVIAEGVETAAQLEILRQMGCEYGQGYYFSRAVTASAAEAMIARQSTLAGTGLLDPA
ncbi:MAG TPA: EAL domain-containing protein [Nannocystis sp.]|jgi:diguanylate cyclase (GGDEF)-like protein/PAS domain S-box-containing protein